MFSRGWLAPWIPFILVSAAPGSRRHFACDLGGDLFYPQSILFQSVNLECARAVAVRVSEIAQGRNGAGVYVLVLRQAPDDTRLNEERREKKKKARQPTTSWRVLVGKFEQGKQATFMFFYIFLPSNVNIHMLS